MFPSRLGAHAARSGLRPRLVAARPIATSGKRSDTATAAAPATPAATAAAPGASAAAKPYDPDKNWVSFGFDRKDRVNDENVHNAAYFFTVTIGLVLSGFIIAYRPNGTMRDWTCREAFLELRRREQLGLPHVDPNYVDPASVVLPPDEDLEGVDIQI